jgi:hypothetical protein
MYGVVQNGAWFDAGFRIRKEVPDLGWGTILEPELLDRKFRKYLVTISKPEGGSTAVV